MDRQKRVTWASRLLYICFAPELSRTAVFAIYKAQEKLAGKPWKNWLGSDKLAERAIKLGAIG